MQPAKPKGVSADDNEDTPAKGKSSVTLTADQLKPFVGNYWSEELQIPYRLALEEVCLSFV